MFKLWTENNSLPNNKIIKTPWTTPPPTPSHIFSLCLSKLESKLLTSGITGLLSIKHLGGGLDFDTAASCRHVGSNALCHDYQDTLRWRNPHMLIHFNCWKIPTSYTNIEVYNELYVGNKFTVSVMFGIILDYRCFFNLVYVLRRPLDRLICWKILVVQALWVKVVFNGMGKTRGNTVLWKRLFVLHSPGFSWWEVQWTW